ncbi:MAG TPA: TIGR01777 family oxidoreductase [Candidatus Acidoferrales bacterium]|nr:TIGR01777 family oxidoreductase [Candidatus Acidoferrales bacterium]
MRVLVLGASGFIGRHLVPALERSGHVVLGASLRDPVTAASQAATCEAIVNLAGETVAQRWSSAAKARIRESRVELPERFLEALARHERQSFVYLSASAIGYYPVDPQAAFDEETAPGDGFLARVCQDWEATALRARDLGMRVALIRTGVALGTDGGALAKILPIFRAGGGGPLGSGKQWFSWIHVDDVAGIYLKALEGGEGAFNATAPNPVTNLEFTRALAAAVGRASIVPVPSFALRLMLGEGAQAVIASQRVVPKRTLGDLEYAFAYPELAPALRALLGGRN